MSLGCNVEKRAQDCRLRLPARMGRGFDWWTETCVWLVRQSKFTIDRVMG